MGFRALLAFILLVTCFAFAPALTSYALDSADLCDTPGNLIQNCRFDQGSRGVPFLGELAKGWGGFIISSTKPNFNTRDCDSPEPPCQRVWSDGEQWDAGIYQQVNVTPGQGYRARIGWFTPMCDDARNVGRIGMDPTGGTNPSSASIVWNDWIRLNKSNGYGSHQVKAAAQSSTITVFMEAKFQMQCSRGNVVWFDAVILVPDGSVAPAPTIPPTPVPPTSTRIPTAIPTRPPATNTPTRVPPTPTPLALTSTSTPSPTATVTSMETATAAPPETTASAQLPVAARRTTQLQTEGEALSASSQDTPNDSAVPLGLLGASGCSLLLSLLLGGIGLRLWRKG